MPKCPNNKRHGGICASRGWAPPATLAATPSDGPRPRVCASLTTERRQIPA